MATLIIGAVLAASPILGPAAWLISSLIMTGAGFIDMLLFAPKTPDQEGPRMDDLKIQTSTFGAPIPIVYGTTRIAGNIIWGTDYTEHTKTESASSGGKGGGGAKVKSYTYSITFAVGLAQGPCSFDKSLQKVWADGKIFDMTDIAYTFYEGTETQMPDTYTEGILGVGNVPGYRGLCYIVFHDLNVSPMGNRIPSLSFEIKSNKSNKLNEILSDISLDAGLTVDDIDVTDPAICDITISGMYIDGNKSFRERIEPLSLVYLFDGVETNGKVAFKKRNLTKNVVKITDSELGAYESSASEDPYTITRKYERELPASLWLEYIAKDGDYQLGGMPAYRINTVSKEEQKITVPIVMEDADAKSVAELRLFEQWSSRSTFEAALSLRYAYLIPGNPIEVTLNDGSVHLLMIVKTSFGGPGIFKITAVFSGATAYTTAGGIVKTVDTITGITSYTTTTAARIVDTSVVQTPALQPTTVYHEIMDICRLPGDTSTDYDFAYVAAGAVVFYGANTLRTYDGGTTWPWAAENDVNATIGATNTLLNSGPVYFFDEGNTVTVTLINGTLSSHTKEEVYAGYNLAIIGNEIIQFRTATLIAEKVYVLSGLLRGCGGTDDQIGTHTVTDRFVLLIFSSLERMPIPTTDRNVIRNYKFGPYTKAITSNLYSDKTFTSTGRSYRNWSVCQVKGVRDDTGELTISWVPRSRVGSTWSDYIDVTLTSPEVYTVEIMSESTVVREVTVTAATTYVYTVANQTADFGSSPDEVMIRIYQMDTVIGRGIVKEITI